MRASSTPQIHRKSRSNSPSKRRSDHSIEREVTLGAEKNERSGKHSRQNRTNVSKSKSKEKHYVGGGSSAKQFNALLKKKNRYKAKLIALRQHAQLQDQQIIRLSQNLSGVEAQSCTLRNEKDTIQGKLDQLEKDYAQQKEELTTKGNELQSAEQLVA